MWAARLFMSPALFPFFFLQSLRLQARFERSSSGSTFLCIFSIVLLLYCLPSRSLCVCMCVHALNKFFFFFYKAAWFFDGPVILRRLVHVVLEFSECFWFSSFPFLVVALMWADLFVFSQVAACACASEGLGECVCVCVSSLNAHLLIMGRSHFLLFM